MRLTYDATTDVAYGRLLAPRRPRRRPRVSFRGSLGRVQVGLPDGTLVVAQVPAADVEHLSPGTAVRVTVGPSPVFAAPA